MPIYEYQCESCGHEFEKLQKMSDEPLKDCPACEAPKLRKLVSAAAFRLKGGGWYETDFKNGSKKNLANTEAPKSDASKSDAGSSATTSDTGSSTKSEGKSEGKAKSEVA